MALPTTGQLGGTPSNATFKTLIEAFRDAVSLMLGGGPISELTIASGVISPPARDTGAIFTVDTEGNAASDQLDLMALTNVPDGSVVGLQASNAARVVTIKHAAGSAGQYLLKDAVDFVYASTSSIVWFQRRTDDMVEIGRDVPFEDLVALTAVESADLVQVWDDSANKVKKASAIVVGRVVQAVEATPYTTYASTSVQLPTDDTVPQITEGGEYITVTITPTKTSHRLVIEAAGMLGADSAMNAAIALFQDSTANALAATAISFPGALYLAPFRLRHEMAAGTTSATTFRIRIGRGGGAGNVTINGSSSARVFGGISALRLRVTEIAA